MMTLLTGFLTAVLVLVCIFLIFLVLMQLPKKEAGLGTAFGSSATDALFGAGTGNALSKMTKYSTGIFIVLTIVLACIGSYQNRKTGGVKLREAMEKAAKVIPPTPPPTTPSTTAKPAVVTPTNLSLKLGDAAPATPAASAPVVAQVTNTIKLQVPPVAATNPAAK